MMMAKFIVYFIDADSRVFDEMVFPSFEKASKNLHGNLLKPNSAPDRPPAPFCRSESPRRIYSTFQFLWANEENDVLTGIAALIKKYQPEFELSHSFKPGVLGRDDPAYSSAGASRGDEMRTDPRLRRVTVQHGDYFIHILTLKGLIIPDETKTNSAAMSAWIDSNRGTKRRKRGRKTAAKSAGSAALQSTVQPKRPRKRKTDTDAVSPAPTNSVAGTPLRIPYGNKEVALKLGARYRSGGWYAPPGVELSVFDERGWL
jgi:hypothetical protein